MTPKGDPNTRSYLENSWRCYSATIANYRLSAIWQYGRLS